MATYKKIGCVFSGNLPDTDIKLLKERYSLIDLSSKEVDHHDIDLLLVIGGDGLMLRSLHNYAVGRNIKVYGLKYGTIGFLLNEYSYDNLIDRIDRAVATDLILLSLRVTDIHGNVYYATAINEASLLRSTSQAATLEIKINAQLRMDKLVADGVMVSTPAGSTAYNFSAGGSILPLESNLLALTAINAFRPRRWHGALISTNSFVEINVIDPEYRRVTVAADYTEFHSVAKLEICKDDKNSITLLFDPGHSLEERIIREQFSFY